ncbi:MAG TPA: 4-alpha-glucanotransferase, partial [Gemmataceae bacterium]|nr:4-alpha-glucanotransferase [Gemmataceae bacterium]
MTISNATRSAGILLHPTSLPGPYGIGDLGGTAYRWVDRLAQAKQTWWQMLPLNPTGLGDSPYSSFSAFAGNPLLVSPDTLAEWGLVRRSDLDALRLPEGRVDYGAVIERKTALLTKAWENFRSGAADWLQQEFEVFAAEQAQWLDDFVLFMAIKESRGGQSWTEWPEALVLRLPEALASARLELADRVAQHRFRQFLFSRQWRALKGYAHERSVRLIGDIPIFVAADSADVWANPGLFLLDEKRQPKTVSGVPPDYFAKTGQLWGNPHYDWEALAKTDYAWWVARFRTTLEQVDLIRIDHFIAFDKAWHIPYGSKTAEHGEFVAGPGADFFDSVRRQLGGLPFIAEDLGLVTPEVEQLRDDFEMPGMLILQFAFGGATENRFLPHNYERNAVVYTGTHDNDTTQGWFTSITDHEREQLQLYTLQDGSDVAWDLIRLAWGSVANYALAPLQDVLNLGPEARMNLPGQAGGNWGWRFRWEQLTDDVGARLR